MGLCIFEFRPFIVVHDLHYLWVKGYFGFLVYLAVMGYSYAGLVAVITWFLLFGFVYKYLYLVLMKLHCMEAFTLGFWCKAVSGVCIFWLAVSKCRIFGH